MAALNRRETEDLQNTVKLIELIQREGYDPKCETEKDKQISQMLVHSRALVRTVIQMKGYYPK